MEREIDLLAAGLATCGLHFDRQILRRQLEFLDELQRWNQRINLTAIRERAEAIEKHLIDSLILLRWLGEGTVLDVGSGAGLPAIPLALAEEERIIVSVEAVAKKVSFQKHIRRTFGMTCFEPICSRVELLKHKGHFSIITARAFAAVDRIIELTEPLLEQGGRLLLQRGPSEDIAALERGDKLNLAGFRLNSYQEYRLPFSGSDRQILEISRG